MSFPTAQCVLHPSLVLEPSSRLRSSLTLLSRACSPASRSTTVSNPRLRVLNKLKAGEFPLMTFSAIGNARHAQILSLTGLDGIIVDCEHGNVGDDAMHNCVSAIAALGVSPVIRIRGTGPDIIKRALDTGAQCV